MTEKEPRWIDEPPPGFKPDGTSIIGSSAKSSEEKIKVGDQLLSPEEFEALQADEEDDDLSDLDEMEEIL